jgi:hypothetical protein
LGIGVILGEGCGKQAGAAHFVNHKNRKTAEWALSHSGMAAPTGTLEGKL